MIENSVGSKISIGFTKFFGVCLLNAYHSKHFLIFDDPQFTLIPIVNCLGQGSLGKVTSNMDIRSIKCFTVYEAN